MVNDTDKLKQIVNKTNRQKEVKEIIVLLEKLPIGQFMLLLEATNTICKKYFPQPQQP